MHAAMQIPRDARVIAQPPPRAPLNAFCSRGHLKNSAGAGAAPLFAKPPPLWEPVGACPVRSGCPTDGTALSRLLRVPY